MLDGVLAVPFSRNPLQRGRIPARGRPGSMYTVAEVVLMTRSRAMVTHEPRQDRKVAAVSGSDHVMWGHLAGANPWSCRGSGVQRWVHGLFFSLSRMASN